MIGQREVVEEKEARAMASSPMLRDEVTTVTVLGTQIQGELSDREVVMTIYDIQERGGQQIMEPVKIVHLPRSGQLYSIWSRSKV